MTLWSGLGKEKVIATFHHRYQHPLYQVVVRIDQDVVRFEPIELESELNDYKFSGPEQGMTKIESDRGDFSGDDFVRSERQKTALLFALFDQA